jgi:hypothetical protein
LMFVYVISNETPHKEKIAMALFACLSIPNIILRAQKNSNDYSFLHLVIATLNFAHISQIDNFRSYPLTDQYRAASCIVLLTFILNLVEYGVSCIPHDAKKIPLSLFPHHTDDDDNKNENNQQPKQF